MKNLNSASCSKCGASVNESMIYCPYCGALRPEMQEVLKNQAELQFLKDKNDEELRMQRHAHRMETAKMSIAFGTMILGLLIIFLMCLFGTGRL